MKKLFLTLAIVGLFTGCASAPQKDPAIVAKQTCVNAGFVPGTDKFGNCFLQVMQHTMEQQSKPTAFQQYMINRAANPPSRSSDVVCRPWLNGVRCEEW